MIEMNWFLPTGGDSRDVLPDDSSINRAPSHAYLAQIARACEELGFDALLTPCGTGCEDAWLATSSLIALTSRIKFLVAFRPALHANTCRTNGKHIPAHVERPVPCQHCHWCRTS